MPRAPAKRNSQSSPPLDHPPSDKQLEVAEWYAAYRGIPLPNEVRTSNNAWWSWINRSLRRIDLEDAREAKMDFGIDVEYDSDPVTIIGALKYRDIVRRTPRLERAKQMLLRGTHPYLVEDELWLTPEQRDEAVRQVEATGYEINWGSV